MRTFDDWKGRALHYGRRFARLNYHAGKLPTEDRDQVALLGLLQALARRDPSRSGAEFSSYVRSWVERELRAESRRASAVPVPAEPVFYRREDADRYAAAARVVCLGDGVNALGGQTPC